MLTALTIFAIHRLLQSFARSNCQRGGNEEKGKFGGQGQDAVAVYSQQYFTQHWPTPGLQTLANSGHVHSGCGHSLSNIVVTDSFEWKPWSLRYGLALYSLALVCIVPLVSRPPKKNKGTASMHRYILHQIIRAFNICCP